jgi:hypothetical protein
MMEQKNLIELLGNKFAVKSIDTGEVFSLETIETPLSVIEEIGLEKGTFQTLSGDVFWLEIDAIHNQILKKLNIEDMEEEEKSEYEDRQYLDAEFEGL